MTTATKVQWRVQVRKSRTAAWKNKGLFETRDAARKENAYQRDNFGAWDGIPRNGYGFGNTRVIRYVKGQK